MKHLDTSEIIEFVTDSSFGGCSRQNTARINLHILNCRECLQRVKAFSVIYGEGLTRTDIHGKGCLVEEKKEKTLRGKKLGKK